MHGKLLSNECRKSYDTESNMVISNSFIGRSEKIRFVLCIRQPDNGRAARRLLRLLCHRFSANEINASGNSLSITLRRPVPVVLENIEETAEKQAMLEYCTVLPHYNRLF